MSFRRTFDRACFLTAAVALGACSDDTGAGGSGGSDGDGGGSDSGGNGAGGGPPPCEAHAFSTEGAEWALPPVGETFEDPGGSQDCPDVANGYRFSTLDLTGDGLPDLVVTLTCFDGGVGEDHWLLYRNNGTGFAPTAEEWALPPVGQTFEDPGGSEDCPDVANGYRYTTLDLTGDGLADLVVTLTCFDGGVGEDHWLLYRNTGDGFAGTAEEWSLPSVGQTFEDPGGSDDCTDVANGYRYSTLDLTGDRLPDLVVTLTCFEGGVGEDHWLLYTNTGNGFASTGEEWTLPAVGQTFEDPGGSNDCPDVTNGYRYSTLDLTGDGLPDLVVTLTCFDGGVGEGHWLLYQNDGDGFAGSADEWALPSVDQFFEDPGGSNDCPDVTNGYRYSTLDLTGDGLPDLVVTLTCFEGGVGEDHWLLYQNGGDGFAGTAEEWALPAVNQIFEDPGGSNDCPDVTNGYRYSTLDLTGDAKPDLVVTLTCFEGGIGQEHWLVYSGVCE